MTSPNAEKPSPSNLSASDVFIRTLIAAGITHVFVNLGSDHPAMMQAFMSGEANGLHIITAPNEMVGLSAAQGFAQATGKAAAVVVHVDCGTQALAGAVHNAARSRTPVLIYAGASPSTQNGELRGSRNEWIHWIQDPVDQPAILRQYMKHVAELRSGRDISSHVMRSIQIANSTPRGPVYVWAAREVSEEGIPGEYVPSSIPVQHFSSVEPSAFNPQVVRDVVTALANAQHPLLITSYLGANPHTVALLVKLSELLGVRVMQACPSVVNFPAHHRHALPTVFAPRQATPIREADVILIWDADTPWVPVHVAPKEGAKIYHFDVDPLKMDLHFYSFPATTRACVDGQTGLEQLIEAAHSVLSGESRTRERIAARTSKIETAYKEQLAHFSSLETPSPESPSVSLPYLLATLRRLVPKTTAFLNEAISNYGAVWDHLRPSGTGSLYQSGASSLGWALGAAVGVGLAGQQNGGSERRFVCVIVGDGSFMFGVPTSAYWMARKYNVPFLCVVLNNGGWKSPGLSMKGVYPDAVVSASATATSFAPAVDYGKVAEAAGSAWHRSVLQDSGVEKAVEEAVAEVVNGRCALLDVSLQKI